MALRTRSVLTALLPAVLVSGIALGGVAHAASKPQVKVLLSEWIVKPKPKKVAAGKVKFVANNAGAETHELVVVRGDDPEALPTDADGAVDEAQLAETDIIGEIEDIESKKTKKATFKLTPGKYILFCNIVEEEATGEKESHFAEGMVNTITVKK